MAWRTTYHTWVYALENLFGTCCLTTAVAIVSVYWAGHARMQRRVMSWVGGLLLGIGTFWVLPEMATQWGWAISLGGVSAILAVLAWIDRYIYPICPFCAAGSHPIASVGSVRSHRHTVAFGWPLLVVGCAHSFLDGWTGNARSSVESSGSRVIITLRRLFPFDNRSFGRT